MNSKIGNALLHGSFLISSTKEDYSNLSIGFHELLGVARHVLPRFRIDFHRCSLPC